MITEDLIAIINKKKPNGGDSYKYRNKSAIVWQR